MIKIITARVTPEGMEFEGEEPLTVMDINPSDGFIPVSGLKYKLRAELLNNKILVTGNANITFQCHCDKCLSEFKVEINNNEICHLYEKIDSGEIYLTENIREDILVSLSHKFLCSKNCRGICFNCGQNLNEKKCSCSKRKSNSMEWDELNKLNF